MTLTAVSCWACGVTAFLSRILLLAGLVAASSLAQNQTIPQPTGTSLGGNLLDGGFNADLYVNGSGNNGVGNLTAIGGACHTGPCSIVIPVTSASTENVSSLQLPDNVTVLDRRPGTLGSTMSNCLAAAGWCKVLTYNNSSSNNPYTFGLTINNNFQPQGGFNWGGGSWSGSKVLTINSNYQTSGIEQDININDNYYSTGDKAIIYGYAYGNAGCTGSSDECQKLADLQGGQPLIVPGQTVPFYQATVASGMTAGVTWLQVAQTLAQQNAMKFPSDGSMILDLNPAAALTGNITGADNSTTPLLAGSNVYSFPVDFNVPVSTAFGMIGAAMPQPNKGFTSTGTFSVALGPGSGPFVTGVATLAGESSPERAGIVAGAVTAGTPNVQQVTITYRWPNRGSAGTSLWQGGLDTMAISLDRNLARDGWPQAFAAVGAIDSNHIGYTINNDGSTFNNTLGYYFGPMQIVAISRNSSGLVTALSNNAGAYSMQSTITIAGSGTAPSMDGPCSNVRPFLNGAGTINGVTCQETAASAVTGTTATATMPGVNGIHLYPYADNIGPMAGGALHLGPNTVNWQPGHALENPAYPMAQITGLSLGVNMNTPTESNPSLGLDLQEHGSGTAGYYSSIRIANSLPCQWLEGCGGTLFPKTNLSVFGAYLTHENLQYSPFPGGSLITIGPSMTTSLPGGYDDLHGYCLFYVQNSSLCYNPATQAWLIPSIVASSISTTSLAVTGLATVGGQSVCEVDGTNCGILTGSLTTTANASDTVTMTGLTPSSHCTVPAATNAAASAVMGLYVNPSANTLTVFHNAVAGMTFSVMCTVF